MAGTRIERVPFNGVDGLMRGLDEPRRPQTIELEVAIAQRLDDERVRGAVATAVGLHPMARARQLTAKPFDLNYAWRIDDALTAEPIVVRSAGHASAVDEARNTFFSQHIDLETEAPFRLLVVHEPMGDRVMLSVSHVAFDGIGALRLLQSISRAYAGEDDDLPDLDPLEVRGLLDEPGSRRGSPTSPLKIAPPPARLAVSDSDGPPGFGILHLDLGVAEAAPPSGATINDMLMAALHLSVQDWNRPRNTSCNRVSIMMPVNQRPESWRSEVLANLVLSAQVVSTASERARPDRLLESVARQTRAIKADGVGASAGLAKTSQAPIFLRRLVPHVVDAVADRTADTTVLSNLGRVVDPPWFGGEGRGLWFSPPPRTPVVLTVGAATTDDVLGVSFRWCRSALSAAEVSEFGEVFLASLRALRDPG